MGLLGKSSEISEIGTGLLSASSATELPLTKKQTVRIKNAKVRLFLIEAILFIDIRTLWQNKLFSYDRNN